MVLSYFIYKYPYKLLWNLKHKFSNNSQLAFYCADPLDYEMFSSISKYLPKLIIIAKNKKTREYLTSRGIKYQRMPSFPSVVIMARHMPYKFPEKKIIKIGFDHGLYQFKRWTSAKNYNDFNIYFVSSESQVKIANTHGIKSVKAIGYPKLDKAFNGEYDEEYLNKLKKYTNIDVTKKTILFTTTWDVAGLSAIDKWIDNIELLTSDYNIIVTVHTWTKDKYKQKLKSTRNIFFIEEFDVTPYLLISDLLVGDYSSIIGEFCAFDRPIITFRVPESEKTIREILQLIENISKQISSFDELKNVLVNCLEYPNEKSVQRNEANKLLFFKLDGKAGQRAAKEIKKLL